MGSIKQNINNDTTNFNNGIDFDDYHHEQDKTLENFNDIPKTFSHDIGNDTDLTQPTPIPGYFVEVLPEAATSTVFETSLNTSSNCNLAIKRHYQCTQR